MKRSQPEFIVPGFLVKKLQLWIGAAILPPHPFTCQSEACKIFKSDYVRVVGVWHL